jgi:hypothetical protein
MTNRSCDTCGFWDKVSVDSREIGWGFCRRNAPVVICMTPNAQYPETYWPSSQQSDWCGEYRPKEAVK